MTGGGRRGGGGEGGGAGRGGGAGGGRGGGAGGGPDVHGLPGVALRIWPAPTGLLLGVRVDEGVMRRVEALLTVGAGPQVAAVAVTSSCWADGASAGGRAGHGGPDVAQANGGAPGPGSTTRRSRSRRWSDPARRRCPGRDIGPRALARSPVPLHRAGGARRRPAGRMSGSLPEHRAVSSTASARRRGASPPRRTARERTEPSCADDAVGPERIVQGLAGRRPVEEVLHGEPTMVPLAMVYAWLPGDCSACRRSSSLTVGRRMATDGSRRSRIRCRACEGG